MIFFLIFFLYCLLAAYSQYQQTTFLSGNPVSQVEPVSIETNVYHQDNTPGGRSHSQSFLISDDKEIIIFFGYSNPGKNNKIIKNDVWKYSIELRQWKFLKGVNDFHCEMDVVVDGDYDVNNLISPRFDLSGWMNTNAGGNHLFSFFGGISCHRVDNLLGYRTVNDLWTYNMELNQWKRVQAGNITNTFSIYENFDEYRPENSPQRRGGHLFLKVDEKEVIMFGGIDHIREEYFGEWWMISTENYQWKILGDDDQSCSGSYNSEICQGKIGTKDVYDSSNIFGGRSGIEGCKINDEEILLYGGQSGPDDDFDLHMVQKYNITSNMFKYVWSHFGYYEPKEYGRTYHTDNAPLDRIDFHIWKINENEVKIFGGNGEDQYMLSMLRDEWVFNHNIHQWKFTGKENSIGYDRYAYIGEPEETIFGTSSNSIFHYLEDSNEAITCFGHTYSLENIVYGDTCWKLYYGNMCNQIEDRDENVCLKRGTCESHNKCKCNNGYFGDDCELTKCNGILSNDSLSCSNNGICLMGKCACLETSFYIDGNNCRINTELQGFVESIPWLTGVFIVLCIIGSIIIVGSVVTFIVVKKYKTKLQTFNDIEDIDILLQESKAQKAEESFKPKIKIDKSKFEVNYDDLKLLKLIGEGGSDSSIYLVDWKGTICVYKGYNKSTLFDTQTSFDEFEKEVSIFSNFNHPSILQCFGACINPPKIGILLQYCPNGDVVNFLSTFTIEKKRKYPIIEKIRILIEIASGMEYMHSKGLMHRDLKPENVLIDENENSKIMDFGLSKLTTGIERTMTKRVGTSFYMSPDVILSGKYTNKCDVYSFAILTYVVITEEFYPYGQNANGSSVLKNVSEDFKFRPKIKRKEFKNVEFLIQFIQKNWDANPTKRDSFVQIVKFLKEEKKNMKVGNFSKGEHSNDSKLQELERINRKNKSRINELKKKIEMAKVSSH